MFLRRGFSFLSYQNCVFDLLSYRNHLLVWFQLNWKLRALCHKKQQFSFATKHAVKSFIGRKIYFGLFGVKLGSLQRYCTGKKISFQLSSEWPWFLLDCPQNNVLACFWLSYTVFSVSFLRTTFATFPYMKYVFDALIYQKHVIVCLQLGLVWVSCHIKRAFFCVYV